MEHRQILTILLAFATNPGNPPSELNQAIAHMVDCPTCATRTRQLVAALRLPAEDQLTCEECEELIPTYLAASAPGQADPLHWAALQLHLVGCPACSEALADLIELQGLAESTLGAEPPAYPIPGRAARPATRGPWRLDSFGRLLVNLAEALLPPPPAVAPAGLKAAPGQTTLGAATLADALPDLELHIAVEGRPGTDRAALLVTVTIPSRGGWPNLGGSEVSLLDRGKEIARATTDAFGKAVFPDLDLSALERFSLAVEPPGGRGLSPA